MSSDVSEIPEIPYSTFEAVEMRVAQVISAPLTEGTRAPSRELTLDLGPHGQRKSIGQYALIDEDQLVGRKVIACLNLGVRKIGKYRSEALTMGTDHPDSPAGQAQAIPLYAHADAVLGDRVY